ncbi:MAG: universal stress protein [Gemmatimonadaceae bacterium]|nr:universal stress protein [Gemmatimonadaceae bacterium]
MADITRSTSSMRPASRASTDVLPESELAGPVLLAAEPEGAAEAPLTTARLLAERLGQPLHVVTVLEPQPIYRTAPEVAFMIPTFGAERDAAYEAAVRRSLAQLAEEGGPGTIHLPHGHPAREIVRTASAIGASVIVMGAAPHRRGQHFVSGVRAAQVLRRAPCAVLSVAPGVTGLPRRIVAAIDFSPDSLHAAHLALRLADEHAVITLVHVLPEFRIQQELQVASGTILGDVAALLDRVREGLLPHAPAAVEIETRVAQGSAASEVLAIADALNADLVAVGTHGPGRVERYIVGSVAAHVLHRSACSVLATPRPGALERMELELWMSGTAVTTDPAQWPAVLDAFSRRNAGRLVTVEIDDPKLGAQVEATGYALRGVTYDPHDRVVEIMLSEAAEGNAHMTHGITGVTAVGIAATAEGDDRVLEVRHGRGHTLVLFDD